MRPLRALLLVGAVALSSGCEWVNRMRGNARPVVSGGKLEPKPAKDFVTYLNRQAGYVDTVRYDSVSLKADLPDVRIPIPRMGSGLLVCGKDRSLRLQAGYSLGGDQLDVGSNAQEMWMYVQKPEPTFLVCAHADFPRVQQDLPVPFEPDWVLQALGLAAFPDRPDYEVELSEKNRAYYLKFDDRSANGQPLKKVIEFAGDEASGTAPQVLRHLVLAQSPDTKKWEVLTSAEVRQVQSVTVGTDPDTRQPVVAQLPTHLVFEWPKQKVKMDLRLGDLKVNDGKTPATMFVRPATLGGANPINLAEYRITPRGAAPQSNRPRDRRDLPPPLPDGRR